MNFRKISVLGLGYIGLPTAAMLASSGMEVTGIEVSENIIDTVNRGTIHIVEPGLESLVENAVSDGKLFATKHAQKADAFLIAVPTPFKSYQKGDPEPDLSYIMQACKTIAPVLQKGNLIVLESTVPVGTTEKICAWLSEIRPDLRFPAQGVANSDVHVAHCPERVLPGNVLHELVHNDRIIGGITPECSHAACTLYKSFVKGECHISDARTAEMAKLTENASRDAQIAFANELSIICDQLKINVFDLIKLANRHPRVNILEPGAGVGGHCIAVDPWFIVHSSPDESKIIKLSREINNHKTDWVINKIHQIANEKPLHSIVLYGLTFKADTDDLRNSPALLIAKTLTKTHGERVLCLDPYIDRDNAPNEIFFRTLEDPLPDEHIKVILVPHSNFKGMQNQQILKVVNI